MCAASWTQLLSGPVPVILLQRRHNASTQAATTRRCTYMRFLLHLRVCSEVLYESKDRKAKRRVTDTADTTHPLLTVLDASSYTLMRIYQGGMFTGVC